VDGFTAEVVAELGLAGIRPILLKGPALATWLYGRAPRNYADADLLIAPDEQAEAMRILERLGFERVAEEKVAPQEGPPHAWPWARARDGAEVDLHHTLFGVGVGPEVVWDELAGKTEPLTVAGAEVEAPTAPVRALVVALHAAQHGPGGDKHIEDLARALDRADWETWAEAAALAARLDASHTFATGLRLVRPGERLADRLGLVDASLVESSARAPLVIGLDRLAHTRGIAAKLRLVGRELVPRRDYMRWRFRIARRGVAGLAAAYLWRPLWLLRHAAPSVRAWRAARRRERDRARLVGPAASARPPSERRYSAFGLRLASFPLPGLREEARSEPPDVTLHLAGRDEVEEAWTGDRESPATWETVLDGRPFRLESGRGGDYRFSYGEAALFHLSADGGTLLCAPLGDEDAAWQRVLLDTVLTSTSLAHGFEALHAGAVELHGGAVAVMSATGGGKTTLIAELVRRGAPLLADDVVALTHDASGAVAYPSPPVMNLALDGPGPDPGELGAEVLATIGDEAWIALPGASRAPRPLTAVFSLERRPGSGAAVEREHPTAVDLLASSLSVGRAPDRMRDQFTLFADVADRVPFYRLTADPAAEPALLADLVERALDARDREAVAAR
jgi:hypothetical protein